MKRIIAISCIILIIIGFSIFSLIKLGNIKDELSNIISTASIHMQKGDFEQAEEFSIECFKKWKKYQGFLGIFIRHNELDEMTGHLSQLEAYAKQKEIALFCGSADRAITVINHIYDNELPLLKNIF